MKDFYIDNTHFLPAITTWPCRTYNNNCNFNKRKTSKAISIVDGEMIVQPMWRMELLGRLYGIKIEEYAGELDWQQYDDFIYYTDTKEQQEKLKDELYRLGYFNIYFRQLAEVASKIGCERTEIKCLIKSLLIEFKLQGRYGLVPYYETEKLLMRLEKSGNREYLRAADRLGRYFHDQLERHKQEQ